MILCKYLIEGYVDGLTVANEDGKEVYWKVLEKKKTLQLEEYGLLLPILSGLGATVRGCVFCGTSATLLYL